MREQKEKTDNVECCVVSCERPLDEKYWNDQYQSNTTGWDLGEVSPPIKGYIDTIENKNAGILIPGCGNSYEAEYLLSRGFTNITLIDIAPLLVEKLRKKFAGNSNIKIVQGDFFEHQMKYDFIIEQTFFCALPPALRQRYVWKMHQLLNENGILFGVLFNRTFEKSPPFGGYLKEYEMLFESAFEFNKMENCENSFAARANTELWIELKSNTDSTVNLYTFDGIVCNGCMETVTGKLREMDGVLNVSMSNDYSELLIVSEKEIVLQDLQSQIAYDAKYRILKINS